jgi:tRNA-dihydrouridine synthase
MMAETGCQGISMGRGALANPWIFRQFVEWEATGEYSPAGNFEDRLTLLLRQLEYLIEQRGAERAIVSFRKMAHWYLKAMCVKASQRNQLQAARTREEFDAAIDEISRHGPSRGSRTGVLPDLVIPVPAGPVEHW